MNSQDYSVVIHDYLIKGKSQKELMDETGIDSSTFTKLLKKHAQAITQNELFRMKTRIIELEKTVSSRNDEKSKVKELSQVIAIISNQLCDLHEQNT